MTTLRHWYSFLAVLGVWLLWTTATPSAWAAESESAFPLRVRANKDYTITIWAKADRPGAEGRLYFNGRAGGKHWYTRNTQLLDTHWRQYTTTTKLPKDIENLSLQFACSDRAVYYLNAYALFETPESAEKSEASGNQIVNGGAERGWYGVGCPINYFGRPFAEYSNWERQIADGGYRGHYCFRLKKTDAHQNQDLVFNPIAVERGKPYCFSV